MQFMVQYGICSCATFCLQTIRFRYWMSICPCWLDVEYQPRSSLCITRIRLILVWRSPKACFWTQTGCSSSVPRERNRVYCEAFVSITYSDLSKRQLASGMFHEQSPHIALVHSKSLQFAALILHCLRLFMWGVDLYASRLLRLLLLLSNHINSKHAVQKVYWSAAHLQSIP